MRGKVPKPGSVEAVIAARFDRKIRDECDKRGLTYPEGVDSLNESGEGTDEAR